MKFRYFLLAFFALNAIFLATYLYWMRSFVEFVPLDYGQGNEELIELSLKGLPPEFQDRLLRVLQYYGADFRLEEGEVKIRRGLYLNTEMVVNLTNKALDTSWLKEHTPANTKSLP